MSQGLTTLQTELFKHQIQTKLFHFQTDSYGAHKASDKYLTKVRTNSDLFMETLRGHLKNSDISAIELRVQAPTDKSFPKMVEEFALLVDNLELPADVGNIRDTMVADAYQLIYLLRFK